MAAHGHEKAPTKNVLLGVDERAGKFVRGRENLSHKLMRWSWYGATAAYITAVGGVALGSLPLAAIGWVSLPIAFAVGVGSAITNSVVRRLKRT